MSGDELLGVGFVCGGAALVVLEVAQGGLGVGLSAVQEVALSGRGGLALGGLEVHEGDVEAGLAGSVAVAGLLANLHGLLVVLAGWLGLAEFIVENAQLVVDGAEVGEGGGGAEGEGLEVVPLGGLGVLQHGFRGLASLAGFVESLVMDHADLLDASGTSQRIVRVAQGQASLVGGFGGVQVADGGDVSCRRGRG